MLANAAQTILKLMPESTAGSVMRVLAARTQRAPIAAFEREVMARATKLHYGQGARHVAWSWGRGPLVILVHGWGGRAAQMAPLAERVAQQGFRSVAIDVTGHGDSPERHTRWEYFLRDIAALSHSLADDVHAYVGHSAGGLSMMAARSLKGIHARRYVCICAPSYPFPPIDAIRRRLNPREGIVTSYKSYIADQFDTTWDRLQAGRAYADGASDLLLFYDEKDRYVRHTEGDRIHALCPGSRLIKSEGYGHVRVLAAPELGQAVGEFLRG